MNLRMQKVFTFVKSLGGLRGKLILGYTFVTVAALLAIELLLFGLAFAVSLFFNNDREQYLYDVQTTLDSQAQTFLQPGSENFEGLQNWLQTVHALGFASLPPSGPMDSPAAPIVTGTEMFVILPTLEILAYAPSGDADLRGQAFIPPSESFRQTALEGAISGSWRIEHLFNVNSNGNYEMAIPVTVGERNQTLAAIIIVTVEPPPPYYTLWPSILAGLGILIGTGLALLAAVTPFGALFGFIMSRGLTRRLESLSIAATAWSRGDFTVLPSDKSSDEIGQLSRHMRNMAEHIQSLLQSQQELSALEERSRLARDLHDTVKQQAFAILMQIRTARRLLDSDPEAARQPLFEAENLTRAAQQELGLLIAELRPAALEGQGLASAIQGYIDSWTSHSTIPCDFQIQGERTIPLDIEQALYRITQEALSNIARHSSASAAEVRLVYLPGQLTLLISDNGQGFDPAMVPDTSFGLNSMRQRIAAIDGSFAITSQTGIGTQISIKVPLPQEAPNV